jgi:COMPASS component BRE2
MTDAQAKASPAPSVPTAAERSKRNKKDSRKKREAKGLDPDGSAAPPKKKAVVAAASGRPSVLLSMLRPQLLAEPRISDMYPPQSKQLNFLYRKASSVLNQAWDFHEVAEKLTNKNGFRYSYAISDPNFTNIKYRQTDVAPYHTRFSFEDSPAAIAFTKDGLAVATSDAWHSARANVCAREGAYYYEARVISGIVKDAQSNTTTPSRGHVRLGFARREAELDVNVGVDCYGYGIRDVNGEVINRMRCEHFFEKGESINEGDVIGLLITLPPLSLHKQVVEGTYDPEKQHSSSSPPVLNFIRDRIPFHLKSDFCWQQSNIYPSKQLRDYAFNLKETPTFGPPSPSNDEDASLRTLPGSSITIYKNGVKMGTPFKDLFAFLPPASRLTNGTNNLGIGERENADDGMIGYFPTVSCYGGGAVECRFEAPWWFGPPPSVSASIVKSEEDEGANSNDSPIPVKPFGERFNDQIVEDIVADIVDDVEAMILWGGDNNNFNTAAANQNTSAKPLPPAQQQQTPAISVINTEFSTSSSPVVAAANGGGADIVQQGISAVYEAAASNDISTDPTTVIAGNNENNNMDINRSEVNQSSTADNNTNEDVEMTT